MKKFLLSALIAAGSVGAHAEGLYVGAAAGGTRLDVDCTSCDKSGTGFKLFGGYKLTDNVAVEAHYADYGKVDFFDIVQGSIVNGDIRMSGFGVGAAFLGDFATNWNGVLRAGVARNRMKASASTQAATLSASESKFKGYLGAGIGYKLTKDVSLNAAIDFTQGEFIGEKIQTMLYTVGAIYNF